MSDDPTELEIKEIKDLLKPINPKDEIEEIEDLLDGMDVEEIDPYTEFKQDHVLNVFERSVTKTDIVKGVDESEEDIIIEGVDVDHLRQTTLYKCICGEKFASKEDAEDHLWERAEAVKRGKTLF